MAASYAALTTTGHNISNANVKGYSRQQVELAKKDSYVARLEAKLLELARAFHSFFEACPVLKSEEPVRSSRLALCELTGRILATGLGLLGIRCPERM